MRHYRIFIRANERRLQNPPIRRINETKGIRQLERSLANTGTRRQPEGTRITVIIYGDSTASLADQSRIRRILVVHIRNVTVQIKSTVTLGRRSTIVGIGGLSVEFSKSHGDGFDKETEHRTVLQPGTGPVKFTTFKR